MILDSALSRVRSALASRRDAGVVLLSRSESFDGYATAATDAGSAWAGKGQMRRLSYREAESRLRLGATDLWWLLLPHDCPVTEGRVVTVRGVRYRIVEVDSEHSGPAFEVRCVVARQED